MFRAFLVSQFSEENIAFYLACEDYQATKTSKLATKAKKIYDEFIGSDAPREVSIKQHKQTIYGALSLCWLLFSCCEVLIITALPLLFPYR